jgi:hypothetical protein
VEENTQTAQLALEELKNQFECYRKNKSYNREPIPKQLWQAAADLAKKHSISTVSKTLGLRYASLKEQIYGPPISKNKLKEKPPSFIELKHSQLLSEMPVTVDIENKTGARMRICLGSDYDIANLIKLFCGP